jgi:ATP-dependent RNA helicase DDX10/DBP4
LLERLYLLKWGPMDGLGAVVISPTRELAVQTFTQLRDIGKYHNFSAGLVIGGKPLKEERDRLSRMNILIATPGRLLQHLDSTVGFESSGVKVLGESPFHPCYILRLDPAPDDGPVLDEADRLLDLGFLPALRAIVGHFSPSTLPDGRPDRQTLLFSATQSKDLASLAKLSLHDPLYINCNKPGEEGVVPTNLEQFYSVVGLERKLDALWGFVKGHLKMKGVVFVTSGKQVSEVFLPALRSAPRPFGMSPCHDSLTLMLTFVPRSGSSSRRSDDSIPVSRSCTSTGSKSSLLVSPSSSDSPLPNPPC